MNVNQLHDKKSYAQRYGNDYTVDGKCSNCGACCSSILPLSDVDVKRIKVYVSKNKVKPIKHVLQTICPFRDNHKKICMIYSARPNICKYYSCNFEVGMKNINQTDTKVHQVIDMNKLVKEIF